MREFIYINIDLQMLETGKLVVSFENYSWDA